MWSDAIAHVSHVYTRRRLRQVHTICSPEQFQASQRVESLITFDNTLDKATGQLSGVGDRQKTDVIGSVASLETPVLEDG